MLQLKRFRVTEFRSVKDSGWIETDAVTALIGTSESGKTNLLVPLWKLNPAREGQIDPIADFPRAAYNKMRKAKEDVAFIEAEFAMDAATRTWLAQKTGQPEKRFETVIVGRRFDGTYRVAFPGAEPVREVDKADVITALSTTAAEIDGDRKYKKEETMQAAMTAAIAASCAELDQVTGVKLDVDALDRLRTKLAAVPTADAAQHSTTLPRWQALQARVDEWIASISQETPDEIEGVSEYIVENLPKFVYYSNYGNLDSEIYLPHVITNMKRGGLGAKEHAKVRTLRILFDYVQLSPEEILELGKPAQVAPDANALATPEVTAKEDRCGREAHKGTRNPSPVCGHGAHESLSRMVEARRLPFSLPGRRRSLSDLGVRRQAPRRDRARVAQHGLAVVLQLLPDLPRGAAGDPRGSDPPAR